MPLEKYPIIEKKIPQTTPSLLKKEHCLTKTGRKSKKHTTQ